MENKDWIIENLKEQVELYKRMLESSERVNLVNERMIKGQGEMIELLEKMIEEKEKLSKLWSQTAN